MTTNPEFSIIIPNLNGSHFLKDCIGSLLQSLNKLNDIKFEIIFVDNGSTDDSINTFTDLIDNSKVFYSIVINKKNLGFARAVNQGIEKSKYDWVILLNNDVTINDNWFELICKEIKNNKEPKAAAFFGTVLNKTGNKFESTGLKFYYRGKAENINNGKAFDPEIIKKDSTFVWGASAALVVYNKNILTHVGMFDEDFFAYEEDVDVALRLHNLGFKTLYVPQAVCWHLGGGTSNNMGNFRNIMDAKNWIYIIIKNFSKSELVKNFLFIFEERLRNLSGLIKSTIRQSGLKSFYVLPLSFFRTYGEVISKTPAMLKKRQQIKKLISET
jgi:GT2 family glycosyltransferase